MPPQNFYCYMCDVIFTEDIGCPHFEPLVKKGRPFKHMSCRDRDDAIRRSKTKYALKEWFCVDCDKIYCMASRWSHIKSKKHQNNAEI